VASPPTTTPARPDDAFSYGATVESYNPVDGTHLVSYTDGTEEWVVLAREKVHLHLHPGEVPPPPSAPAAASDAAAGNGEDVAMGDELAGAPGGPGDEADGQGGDDAPCLPDGLDAVGWRISVFFPGERVW
jgi:hypothetical protein